MAAGLKPLAELLMLEQQYASGLPADDQRAGGQVKTKFFRSYNAGASNEAT